MARIEFTKKTKTIIASRSGYRCCFPGCDKTLIGPGETSNDFITIAEFAHIFSASAKGPRTSGGLTKQELRKPENGLFLCRNHHKIVDSKSNILEFSPDSLTRMKNLHEFKISGEIGEYLYPLNWISNFRIEGGIFIAPISLTMGKVTFIYGKNGVGKSALIEIFQSVFTEEIHPRWNKPSLNFKIKVSFENPVISEFECLIENKKISYNIKEKNQPFVPFQFLVLALNKNGIRPGVDDLKYIAKCIGFTREAVVSLLQTTSLNHGLFTQQVAIENKRTSPYLVDDLIITLKSGVSRTFGALSSTEQSRVIFDIVISYATEVSKYRPTLLLIDWENTYSFSDGSLSPYLEYLQSSKAHFQTLFVSHKERPDLDWTGWIIAKMTKENKIPKLIQNEK